MRPGGRRAVNLIDFLTLVGATAVGLAGLRFAIGDLREIREQMRESLSFSAPPPDSWPPWLWAVVASYGLVCTILFPFCWAWTVSLFALRFRKPRPGIRRMTCQPGAMACYSAAVILIPALFVVVCLILYSCIILPIKYESSAWQKGLAVCFIVLPPITGSIVLGSWITLLAGRRCRAESTWIERAGRLLGAYWISTLLLPVWGLS